MKSASWRKYQKNGRTKLIRSRLMFHSHEIFIVTFGEVANFWMCIDYIWMIWLLNRHITEKFRLVLNHIHVCRLFEYRCMCDSTETVKAVPSNGDELYLPNIDGHNITTQSIISSPTHRRILRLSPAAHLLNYCDSIYWERCIETTAPWPRKANAAVNHSNVCLRHTLIECPSHRGILLLTIPYCKSTTLPWTLEILPLIKHLCRSSLMHSLLTVLSGKLERKGKHLIMATLYLLD